MLGKAVKTLRASGFLPAVLYGAGVASQPIVVTQKEFEKVYSAGGESTLVRLDLGGVMHAVLIHDISRDPVTSHMLHADFHAVRMDKALRARIPLEFIGESLAVKNEGGILVKVVHELEVEALPQDLPHTLVVDISALDVMNARVFLKNIAVPVRVKILGASDEVIAMVDAPRSEEELTALAEAPVEVPVEVKTEREVKKAAEAEAEKEKEAAEK